MHDAPRARTARPIYVVKTANGYVGRWDVAAHTTTDLPRALAASYTDWEEASAVALDWHGAVEAY